ncbi:hypothetical protein QBC43DRAFT_292629 [Cladorrhinum sp. PSN259]|nr:hypothetical protein QBC43DRAFT_292629 [Cladorrhinum sp. PSN259]
MQIKTIFAITAGLLLSGVSALPVQEVTVDQADRKTDWLKVKDGVTVDQADRKTDWLKVKDGVTVDQADRKTDWLKKKE